MVEQYLAYLNLLDDLRRVLESLTNIARQKTDAVRRDDLNALDLALKQEQAQGLALRGLEQRMAKELQRLGLTNVTLSQLGDHYPEELQLKARSTAEALKNQYDLYQAAAEVARNTLECNLHEIEKFLANAESSPLGGAGYTAPGAELPSAMKTDFRA